MTDERVLLDLTEAENGTTRARREVAEVTERANSWQSQIEVRKRTEEELRLIQAQLMNLPARLVQNTETERRQIARELHDDFGQVLATLSWEASGMQKPSSEAPDAITRRSGDFAKKIGALADDVHWMSQRLHPLMLDDLGLEVALNKRNA